MINSGMQTNVYFVRHAQSDHDIQDEMTRPLTAQGMVDRQKVTQALQNIRIAAIYSSPYQRAYDTVQHLAEQNGLAIQTVAGFRERKVDDEWVRDFKAFSRRQWQDFNFKLTNGESLKEVQERNVAALFEIVTQHCGHNVVIGTHGTALSTIINYFNPEFGYDDFWALIDKLPYVLCSALTS